MNENNFDQSFHLAFLASTNKRFTLSDHCVLLLSLSLSLLFLRWDLNTTRFLNLFILTTALCWKWTKVFSFFFRAIHFSTLSCFTLLTIQVGPKVLATYTFCVLICLQICYPFFSFLFILPGFLWLEIKVKALVIHTSLFTNRLYFLCLLAVLKWTMILFL